MRPENEIFEELTNLCQSPGYIHALAGLCFRDTAVGFADQLKAENLAPLSSPNTLIRTELNTLHGLMIDAPIDFALPSFENFSEYTSKSERLLEELHNAMKAPAEAIFKSEFINLPGFNPFASAVVLREPIFYAAQSAYPFQYRDLAVRKYHRDAKWLWDNKGLDLAAAQTVAKAVLRLISDRLFSTVRNFKTMPIEAWTMLPGFTFSGSELATITGLSRDLVCKSLEPFCIPSSSANPTFTSMHAFNSAYAYPIIKKSEDEYILMQPAYGYSEALYDTPFYWMGADKTYEPTAMKNRGDFAEDFASDRLTQVFGPSRVFKNVDILRGKDVLGEIDVLVIFGDRIVVLQAKSKKLTLAARNGNDLQLKGDFKSAVQNAVNQAFSCAELLADQNIVLRCRDGIEVKVTVPPTSIFPITILTDHYPALAFQAKQFLNFQSSEKIVAPLVLDIFALDAITELLSTPLRFLSYIWLRAKASGSVLANHELVTLSYHLQNNLWIASDTDLMLLNDDISLPLDIAMAARREGIPGETVPDGLLTRFAGTQFEKMVAQIESQTGSPAISLGFALMELGEDSINSINRSLRVITRRALKDNKRHDFTLGTENPASGFTFHVGGEDTEDAEGVLHDHCRRRKYISRAERWHGVILDTNGRIRRVATLTGKWKQDEKLELEIKNSFASAPMPSRPRAFRRSPKR